MTQAAQRPAFDPTAIAATMAALAGGTGPASSSAAPAAKEKATIYLAIGFIRDGVDISSADFDPSRDIINLPQLTGLDNMNPDTRRAGTQEFADRQAESNDLLEDLTQEALATLEPGQTRILGMSPNGLVVSLYRKKDEVVAAPKAKRQKRSFLA